MLFDKMSSKLEGEGAYHSLFIVVVFDDGDTVRGLGVYHARELVKLDPKLEQRLADSVLLFLLPLELVDVLLPLSAPNECLSCLSYSPRAFWPTKGIPYPSRV